MKDVPNLFWARVDWCGLGVRRYRDFGVIREYSLGGDSKITQLDPISFIKQYVSGLIG